MADAARGSAAPVVWRPAAREHKTGLIVLLHGNGADEHDIAPLSELFPRDVAVVALRAPVAAESGFRWFAHHDVARPIAASLHAGREYVGAFLDSVVAAGQNVWLVGFSGGALMAGALLLTDPARFAGVAMLHGPLPLDAGIPAEPGRLTGASVFFAYGEADTVIPRDLIDRSAAYLRDESGAHAVVRGYRAAHTIPAAEQRGLARWYADLT